MNLPAYTPLATSLAPLELPFSLSQLHGLLCAYVCTGNEARAASFLHTLSNNEKRPLCAASKNELFEALTLSEQQIHNMDFEIQLMLPEESAPLKDRAKALSEWCEGFLQGLHACHIQASNFDEDNDIHETLENLQAFSTLDYEQLSASEEDEKAFVEVYEYARLAILNVKLACEMLRPQPNEREKH